MADNDNGGLLDDLKQQNYPQMTFATAPDGTTGFVKPGETDAAANAGYAIGEPAVYMHDATGKVGLVKQSEAKAALGAGYNVGLPLPGDKLAKSQTVNDLGNQALQASVAARNA